MAALVRAVYDAQVTTGDIHTPSALKMASSYMDAVYEGTGKTYAGIDYDTPDYQLLRNLEESVFRFSAAKSFEINKMLSGLLKDGNRVLSFNEFSNLAMKELGVYVGQYAKIEYSSALVNSEIAAKVQRFKADADIMPYWQFRTSKGDQVCPICKPYDGMVQRHDHPVWAYAKPQLHFGCYCSIVQLPLSYHEVTPDDALPDPALIPKLFRTDTAGKMQAFPEGHPYYDAAPKTSINKWVNKNLPERD